MIKLEKCEPMTIKVKYFADIEPLVKMSVGDWIDLRSAEDVDMVAGEYRHIRLGVGMILPDGYEAHIMPRSSTFTRYGLIMACSGITITVIAATMTSGCSGHTRRVKRTFARAIEFVSSALCRISRKCSLRRLTACA